MIEERSYCISLIISQFHFLMNSTPFWILPASSSFAFSRPILQNNKEIKIEISLFISLWDKYFERDELCFQTFRIRLRVQADTLLLLLHGQGALLLQRKLTLSPVVNCHYKLKPLIWHNEREWKSFQDLPVKQQKSILRHSHLLLTREGKHLQTWLQHMPVVVVHLHGFSTLFQRNKQVLWWCIKVIWFGFTMESVADPAPAFASTTSVPPFWIRFVRYSISEGVKLLGGLTWWRNIMQKNIN